METSISYSFSIKFHQERVTCRSYVSVLCHPSWTCKWPWGYSRVTPSFTICVPSNTNLVIIPFIMTSFFVNHWRLRDTNCRLNWFPIFRTGFWFQVFKIWDARFQCFGVALAFGNLDRTFAFLWTTGGFSIVFLTFSSACDWELTLGPWLALIAFASVLACIAISLKMCSVALKKKHPTRETDNPCPLPDERVDRSNLWVFTQTRVTRLGITNFKTKLLLHVRHDFTTRIFESSRATGVENQMFLKFLRYQRLQASQLDPYAEETPRWSMKQE